MSSILQTAARGASVSALVLVTGCASLGSLEQILSQAAGGLYGSEMAGQVRQVDTRRQQIEIQSGWGGAERVRYDRRTEVIYRQRRYDVRELEPGDYVRIRVEDDRDREPYASVIHVEESRSDRRGGDRGSYSRVTRIEGQVNRIDAQRGWFEITDSRGEAFLVTLPYEPNRSLRDKFRRIRRGDRVRLEGERLNNTRVEILRFL